LKAVIPALAGALFLFAQGTSQAQQQDFSKFEIQTTELGHGVYMLEGAGGNITVAASPEGVIMVDTQFAPMTAKIKAAIAKITPQPIRYVIDTHYHPDHTGRRGGAGEAARRLVRQTRRR
jgi:cyclase